MAQTPKELVCFLTMEPFSSSNAMPSDYPRDGTSFETRQWTQSQNPMPMFDSAISVDMYGQDWVDPLGALDFSNFAQSGSSDSTFGFGLF